MKPALRKINKGSLHIEEVKDSHNKRTEKNAAQNQVNKWQPERNKKCII